MNLVNVSGMSAGVTVPFDRHGHEHVLVVAKGTFSVRPDGSCVLAEAQEPVCAVDLFHGDPATSSIKYECDFTLRKAKCDVVINGSAHAPGGRPVTALDVGLEFLSIRKTIRVSGDRIWEFGTLSGAVPSAPVPFTSMPLLYERTFGGADRWDEDPARHGVEPRNLVGVGFMLKKRIQLHRMPLPNLEHPRHPLRTPTDKPPPVGVGFVCRNWQPRVSYAGTYDQKWLDTRCPFLPEDFDERHWQGAPEDQQVDHLHGGETMKLINMTPAGRLDITIPKVSIPMQIRFGLTEKPVDLAPVLDTVIVEPDRHRMLLVWRASWPTRGQLTRIREVTVGNPTAALERARELGKRFEPRVGAS